MGRACKCFFVTQTIRCCGRVCSHRLQDKGTPLHTATWYSNVECMRLLLDRGADVNKADEVGNGWEGVHVTMPLGTLHATPCAPPPCSPRPCVANEGFIRTDLLRRCPHQLLFQAVHEKAVAQHTAICHPVPIDRMPVMETYIMCLCGASSSYEACADALKLPSNYW